MKVPPRVPEGTGIVPAATQFREIDALVLGPQNCKVMVPARSVPDTPMTVTESVTEVPGLTVPVEPEVVTVVVGACTWKHSFVVVVLLEPVYEVLVGVYVAVQQ